MLIAASVMNSVSAYVGTSIMKTWLIRRAVRRPVFDAGDRAHQFVGMKAPLHQQLAFARMNHFDGLRGGRLAVAASTISKWLMSRLCFLATAAIFAARPDQDRNDDARLGRLDRAAQRGFVAGMDDDGRRRRNLFGFRNEPVVLGSRH